MKKIKKKLWPGSPRKKKRERERERMQINKIRNERGKIETNIREIKKKT